MGLHRYNLTITLFVAFALGIVTTALATPPPYPLRTPQVAVSGTELQNYLDGVGEAINVQTDQLAAQTYIPSVSGNSGMTLMIELAGNADLNVLGVYDANQPAPVLYPVFPGGAGTHWSAMVSFLANGDLVVNLFDDLGAPQGHTVFPGANIARVGFYLDGPGGLFYSEDVRNGGDPQALMYAGTGRNFGDFWVCWEDLHYNQGSDQDFNDEVLLVQSLEPVPAENSTWGKVKAQYR